MRPHALLKRFAIAGLVVGLAACGANQSAAPDREATAETDAPPVATQPAAPTTATVATTTTADTEPPMDDMDEPEADDTATQSSDHESMDDMDHEDMDDSDAAAVWPRPWDPAEPIDFSGVPGVTAEQQAYAEDLAARTIADLPQFSDPAELGKLGYLSIGDEATGYEHYINAAYVLDDHVLDPNYPESIVFEVDGDQRTLASAMFMVGPTAVDDPELEAIGGPLMQWHVHQDLCWKMTPDGPQVAGTHAEGSPCPDGTVPGGGDVPMIHVWVLPHQCGPFAALEGIGAGQVDPDSEVRMDQCHEDH